MYKLLIIIGLFIFSESYSQSDYIILNSKSTLSYLQTNSQIPDYVIETNLTEVELNQLSQLTLDCVKEYNSQTRSSFKKRGEKKYSKMYEIKNLKEYKFQYVPYINEEGDKIVWINGFCKGFDENWKTEIIEVSDGGNCFILIVLNLTKNTCVQLGTNGYA